jgi:hypothetical protein
MKIRMLEIPIKTGMSVAAWNKTSPNILSVHLMTYFQARPSKRVKMTKAQMNGIYKAII